MRLRQARVQLPQQLPDRRRCRCLGRRSRRPQDRHATHRRGRLRDLQRHHAAGIVFARGPHPPSRRDGLTAEGSREVPRRRGNRRAPGDAGAARSWRRQRASLLPASERRDVRTVHACWRLAGREPDRRQFRCGARGPGTSLLGNRYGGALPRTIPPGLDRPAPRRGRTNGQTGRQPVVAIRIRAPGVAGCRFGNRIRVRGRSRPGASTGARVGRGRGLAGC